MTREDLTISDKDQKWSGIKEYKKQVEGSKMSKKKIGAVVALILFAVLSNILILKYVKVSSVKEMNISFNVDIYASESDNGSTEE